MILGFYAVDNSKGFDRNSFDGMNASQILDELEQLLPEEVRCYDMGSVHDTQNNPALLAFVNDYNNCELDGGWWCVLIETD